MIRAAATEGVEGARIILEHVEGASLIDGLEKLRILEELRVLAGLNELVVGSDGFGDILTAGNLRHLLEGIRGIAPALADGRLEVRVKVRNRSREHHSTAGPAGGSADALIVRLILHPHEGLRIVDAVIALAVQSRLAAAGHRLIRQHVLVHEPVAVLISDQVAIEGQLHKGVGIEDGDAGGLRVHAVNVVQAEAGNSLKEAARFLRNVDALAGVVGEAHVDDVDVAKVLRELFLVGDVSAAGKQGGLGLDVVYLAVLVRSPDSDNLVAVHERLLRRHVVHELNPEILAGLLSQRPFVLRHEHVDLREAEVAVAVIGCEGHLDAHFIKDLHIARQELDAILEQTGIHCPVREGDHALVEIIQAVGLADFFRVGSLHGAGTGNHGAVGGGRAGRVGNNQSLRAGLADFVGGHHAGSACADDQDRGLQGFVRLDFFSCGFTLSEGQLAAAKQRDGKRGCGGTLQEVSSGNVFHGYVPPVDQNQRKISL